MATWRGSACSASRRGPISTRRTARPRSARNTSPISPSGNVVFAGVDYAEILQLAEAEADIIVWDGGNNDFPFLRPDLHIVVADALRPRQIATHHPGEAVPAWRMCW